MDGSVSLSLLDLSLGPNPVIDVRLNIVDDNDLFCNLPEDIWRLLISQYLGRSEMWLLARISVSFNTLIWKLITYLSFRQTINDQLLLAFLSKKCPNMGTLELRCCSGITNELFQYHHEKLQNLVDLQIFNCRFLTEEGIQHLTALTRLSSLVLSDLPLLQDHNYSFLSTLSNITRLGLPRNREIKNEAPTALRTLTNLKSLSLADCCMTDQALTNLTTLTNLDSLDLSRCQLTATGMSHLTSLSKLTSLILKDMDLLTNAACVHLGVLSNLTNLDLARCILLGEPGVKELCVLPKLQTLILWSSNIGDNGLSYLGRCPSLCKLRLANGKRVTDQGMKYLKECTTLKELQLWRCVSVTAAGLALFSNIKLVIEGY